MKPRPQTIIAMTGAALLAILWSWPSLSVHEKTAAHLWGVTASLGTSLGALLLLCIACLCRARWGAAVQNIMQACALSMRVVAMLALPLLLTVPTLIPRDDLPPTQQAWLAPMAFALRGLVYLLTWVLAAEVWRQQRARAEAFDAAPMRRLSAAMLPSLVVTMTLASVDWIMSIAAPWQSTAVGVYIFAGALMCAVSAAIVGAWLTQGTSLQIAPEHVRSLGRLLFTFNFFWAYIAVGQLLIIVMADLPDEVTWYITRFNGPNAIASCVLAIGHFAIPFVLLLFDRVKNDLGTLAAISVWCLGMHALDMHQLIVPSLAADVRPGMALMAGLLGVTSLTLHSIATRWRMLEPKSNAP